MYDDATNDLLEREITTLAGNLFAGTARFLSLIGEFDAREAWGAWGIKSCAHWLEWRCGLSPKTAREQVRVARALRELPAISGSFERGELSYSKVRAITRIASDVTEPLLLEWARHATAAQLERIVRGVRFARAVEDPTERHRQRSLNYSYDEDGFLDVRVRLEPEEGALFLRALEAAVTAVAQQRAGAQQRAEISTGKASAEALPDEGDPWGNTATTPAEQGRADAVVAMAESYLAEGAGSLLGSERAAVMVHVDAEMLASPPGEKAQDGARCEVANGPPLHSETVRRLACDATIVTVAPGDGSSETIGRRSRVVPRRMRRALVRRDRHCRFPSCSARLADAHHIKHWAHGGETSLANLVLLCRRHHRLLHEFGFHLERAPDARLTFRRPDGRAIEASATSGVPTAVLDEQIGPDACEQRTYDARPDYGIAVEGFLRIERVFPDDGPDHAARPDLN